MRGKMKS